MRRTVCALFLVTAMSLVLSSGLSRADDIEIMVGEGPPPNILIILDHSGSMLAEDAEHAYDENKTYTPWAGMPDKGSNYENWRWYHKTRWQVAKHVITHLINDTPGVRFGLMRMDGNLGDAYDNAGTYGGGQDNWGIPDPAALPYEYASTPKEKKKGPPPDQIFPFPFGVIRQGGKLLKPCGTDRDELIEFVNGLEIYKTMPHSYTNLAETLFTAGQYFADGEDVPGTMGRYKDSDDTNWQYGSYWAKTTDDYGNTIDISSPIQYWCQRNYVIFVTDGQANADSDWERMIDAVGDHDGDGDFRETHPWDLPPAEGWCDPLGDYNIDPVSPSPCDDDPPPPPFYEPPEEFKAKWPDALENPFPLDLHTFIDDVAKFLYDTDLQKDMEGRQNVVTYTVGFSLLGEEFEPVKELLNNAATQGGGAYYTADNYEELRDALQQIVQGILVSQTTAFGSPVVPVQHENRSYYGDDIYVAMFKSYDNTHLGTWAGNLKKYDLATAANPAKGIEKGDILDAKGDRATNEAGTILSTARSYWRTNTTPDGGNIFEGGVGEVMLLTPEANRKIYTYLATYSASDTTDLTHARNQFTNPNVTLTATLLGVPNGGGAREKVINYLRGLDVLDEDGDGVTNEYRDWILGDIVHSSPVAFNYTSDRRVIFVGANDGMLHAFDDSTGEELWAYVPPIFFDTIRNMSGATHWYFVDGSPTIWYKENPSDGDLEIDPNDPEDQVLLICGLRRGGPWYFALDVTDPDNPKIPDGWADWGYYKLASGFSPPILKTGMIGPDMSKSTGQRRYASFPYQKMGETWSSPRIGKVKVNGQEKIVAFVGGGYNAGEDASPPQAYTTGKAVFCFDIQTGEKIWEYSNTNNAAMNKAIPSDVALLDVNGNGRVDRLYVGDLGGKIWRFDVGSETVANWTASAKIVFDANSPAAGGRKIFYPPDITEEESHFMLFLGTGDRAHPSGKDVVDRLYAIKDRRDTTFDEDDLVDVTLNRLQDGSAGDEEKSQIRADLDAEDGWFIQLDEAAGEKALSRAIVFGGIFYITTFTPAEEVGGSDPCATDQGTAKLYAINYRTGEAVLNLDLANDPLGEEALERSDRAMVIGSYIPSDLVLVIQGRDIRYYVSVGTEGGPGIKTGWPGEGSSLYLVYWRELF